MGSDDRFAATTLQDYLRVVRRRKWIILLAAVMVPAAAVAFSLHQKHRYRATAEVLLSEQNLAGALTNLQAASGPLDRLDQTQAVLARLPEVARQTLEALGLRERTPGQLLAASSVSPDPNADILDFSVTDPNP